jgi:hypothetical protein
MKRFAVSLIASLLAFTAGLVTASSWTSKSKEEMVEPLRVHVAEPCAPQTPPPLAPVQSFTVTPPREFEFGPNGLKLVPEQVQLKSESLGYDIDVSYPQIVGTPDTNETKIWKVNQHIKDAAVKLYQWPLNPTGQTSLHNQPRSGIRNTVTFTYQVGLATDSFLSLHFIGYSYNGSINQHIQDSFTMNYDLSAGKHLKLSDIFKPRSKYLEFISRYCINELRQYDRVLILEELAPAAENFNTWQITANGLTFNFHGCRVAHCTEGELTVQIPFAELKPMLNPGIPG